MIAFSLVALDVASNGKKLYGNFQLNSLWSGPGRPSASNIKLGYTQWLLPVQWPGGAPRRGIPVWVSKWGSQLIAVSRALVRLSQYEPWGYKEGGRSGENLVSSVPLLHSYFPVSLPVCCALLIKELRSVRCIIKTGLPSVDTTFLCHARVNLCMLSLWIRNTLQGTCMQSNLGKLTTHG